MKQLPLKGSLGSFSIQQFHSCVFRLRSLPLDNLNSSLCLFRSLFRTIICFELAQIYLPLKILPCSREWQASSSQKSVSEQLGLYYNILCYHVLVTGNSFPSDGFSLQQNMFNIYPHPYLQISSPTNLWMSPILSATYWQSRGSVVHNLSH